MLCQDCFDPFLAVMTECLVVRKATWSFGFFLESDQVLDKDMFVVLVRCLIRGAAASRANMVPKGTVFARGV